MASALIAGVSSVTAEAMTPQQYHKEKGPFACPDDKDKAGHKCGKRSAICQPGGAEVECFRAGDIGLTTAARWRGWVPQQRRPPEQ
jgi:hypothetical protein